MLDYERLYFNLYAKLTDVITQLDKLSDDLKQLQCDREDQYIAATEPNEKPD